MSLLLGITALENQEGTLPNLNYEQATGIWDEGEVFEEDVEDRIVKDGITPNTGLGRQRVWSGSPSCRKSEDAAVATLTGESATREAKIWGMKSIE